MIGMGGSSGLRMFDFVGARVGAGKLAEAPVLDIGFRGGRPLGRFKGT